MQHLKQKMEQARELSWQTFGKQITFFLPGMFSCNGHSGRYPALSITGPDCALQCEHCKAKILEPMILAREPDQLLEKCLQLEEKGNLGVLISGGCDEDGSLPWEKFLPAVREVKRRTDLRISVHSGFVTEAMAFSLKEAGVDQVLVDVIGDNETYRRVYHLESGVSKLVSSLRALREAGLTIVPHICCGLDFGKIRAERNAIELLSRFDIGLLVFISLMPIPGTPMGTTTTPRADDVAELIVEARLRMSATQISLGCARERGNGRLEILAIDAGINRMALPSEEALNRAKYYGLEINYQRTCCSMGEAIPDEGW